MQPSQAHRKNLPVRLSRKSYKMSKLGYQGCLRGFSMRVYFHAPSWLGDQSAYIPTENCLTQPQPPSLNLSLKFVTGQLIIKLNWNQLLVGCIEIRAKGPRSSIICLGCLAANDSMEGMGHPPARLSSEELVHF